MKKVDRALLQGSNVAEVALTYRSKVKPSNRPQILSSADSAELLRQLWDEDSIELRESFKVLMLNTAHRVLCVFHCSEGSMTQTSADPRLIYATASKVCATSMILAHNHPSGRYEPSRADDELTLKLKEAGRLFDIRVLDHIILTSEAYFSYADEGKI